MYEKIIQEISDKFSNETINRKGILKELFQNNELKQKFVNEIRRSTIIGQITNEILQKFEQNNLCKILAIWDVAYFWELKNNWEDLIQISLKNIDVQNLSGYDLSWQWSDKLRNSLYNYMKLYYDFSKIEKNISSDIIPTYGATDGFVSILDTIKNIYPNKKINFIYPEASFMANVKIAEHILWEQNIIKINKPTLDNFFFTEEEIPSFKDAIINIYYITSVWNPTGNKIDSKKLFGILSHISINDKNSIFLMDNVYVGILKEKESKDLFSKIFENSEVLQKIIFLESLSKTLWTTGIRIGWIWSINSLFSENIKKTVILKKAGFSKILDELAVNLLSDLEKINNFQNEVYDFWSSQRLKFLEFIKENYSHFFDFEASAPVLDRQWIYIFLKVKNWFNIQEIFAETWLIWVGITLSDGDYIRYAFWNISYF